LVEEPATLSETAREALILLHFDPEMGNDLLDDGHRACCECLLSYSNRLHCRWLNRFRVRDFLMELMKLKVQVENTALTREEH
jgi:hypothetical protein